jgi:thymidine kinase
MSITLYLGCMYSGKTSELIREYKRWQKIGNSVICINYIDDKRYDVKDEDQFMYSHNMEKVRCIKTKLLNTISVDVLHDIDIIMINEGQFFSDIKEFCENWCDKYNKDIIICGLDGDFEREPMGQMNQLISICDNITKLKALCNICKDETPGLFSWRISNNKSKIHIGTDYIPVCRKHYNILKHERDSKDDNIESNK